MREGPADPGPTPRRDDVEARLVPAVEAHQARLEALAALSAPVPAAPQGPPPASGWFAWLAPRASAPDAEARMKAAWQRSVVLRDRAGRAGIEQEALTAQLAALDAWLAVLARGAAASREQGRAADADAYDNAAAVVRPVRDALASAGPLLASLTGALAALAAEEEAAALAAERDLRAGRRPDLGDAVNLHDLDAIVHRLRACAVDRAAVDRSLANRLPIAHGEEPAWGRATDEVSDAQDPIGAWRRRREGR